MSTGSTKRRGSRAAPAAFSLITDEDLFLFNEGSHFRLHDRLGAHPVTAGGTAGTYFAVWAPNAGRVTVMGDWNGWNKTADDLAARGSSGIWERFLPGVSKGSAYKYHIVNRASGYEVDKADPVGFLCEAPPKTASVVWDLEYAWGDGGWMRDRAARNGAGAAISIYELHPGSWRRVPEDGNRSLNYRELAPRLAEYVAKMGFTHVEMLPVMEHPFFGSWGYQTTGYFAPSSRYGTPQDFMHVIDVLHQAGIGVILDWVPSHFPADEHGLAYFDGTHLYEHADPRQGFHPDWKSAIFNYSRHEVRSFLTSSALFWMSAYHADALRVDAVASMLYLDYGRNEGEWIPNVHGGRENLDALVFLRRLNEEIYRTHPDAQTIAEESTAWPMVSRPTYVGGLGFGMKWDMGWMHDTLHYMSLDPVHRKFHHNEMTFRGLYAFHENFVLPLSHDEVVYGKGSLLRKMAGDTWQKFANLRLLFSYMIAQPGKKLVFMGGELAQWDEWSHDGSLDWHLAEDASHGGVQRLVADLNRVYREEAALHDLDFDPAGFEWIDANDSIQSCYTFLRKGRGGEVVLAALNFTPVPRTDYRTGVPNGGFWREILNSDAKAYGGSGHGNMGGAQASPTPSHGHAQSLSLTLPPLGAVFLRWEG
jgi:1,4-alpha-glucan branching enzyme